MLRIFQSDALAPMVSWSSCSQIQCIPMNAF